MNIRHILLSNLKQLEELQDYWDGEYSVKIYNDVVEHAKGIIKYAEEKYLSYWHLKPNNNGTITFIVKSSNLIGSLHVGLHEYSWTVKYKEERLCEEELTNWSNLVTIFNKISENFIEDLNY